MNALLPFTRRGIYLIDAVGCLVLGGVALAFSEPLAAMFGPAVSAAILTGAGLFLAAFALFSLVIALRRDFPASAASVNVAGDALWVAASAALLLLAGTGLTWIGAVVVALLAAGVAAIGAIKYVGLRTEPHPA